MEGAVRSGLTAAQAVRDELAAADRADAGASAAPAGLAASAPDRAASAAAGRPS